MHFYRNKKYQKKIIKPKGEFDDLPPIEDLKISVPEVLCDPLGEVNKIYVLLNNQLYLSLIILL